MGYRSEVALCLSKQGVKEMKKLLKAVPEGKRGDISDFFKFADFHKEDAESGAQFWLWNWCQWDIDDSRGFPEVDFVDNLLKTISPLEYHFLRVGEELGDDEVHGDMIDAPFDLYIQRSIHYSCVA